MKKYKTHIILGLVVLIAAWCLWYARPVDIYFLVDAQEAKNINMTIWPQRDFAEGVHGDLDFAGGTPEMEELMERLSALRFHRSPLEPLLRLLPSGRRSMEVDPEKDYRINLAFFTEDYDYLGRLDFEISEWYYTQPGKAQNKELPLYISDGQEKGRELGGWLWELSQEDHLDLYNTEE